MCFFEGLYAKGSFREGFEPVSVNGEPGLLLRRNGRVSMVLTVDWEPDLSRIRQIFLVVNPDKLRLFNQNSREQARSNADPVPGINRCDRHN